MFLIQISSKLFSNLCKQATPCIINCWFCLTLRNPRRIFPIRFFFAKFVANHDTNHTQHVVRKLKPVP